jgi:hypothetical protein
VAGDAAVPEQRPGLDRLGRRRHHAQFKPGQSGNPFGRRGKPKPDGSDGHASDGDRPLLERLEDELADRLWAWSSAPGLTAERPAARMGRRLRGLVAGAEPEVADRARGKAYKLLSERCSPPSGRRSCTRPAVDPFLVRGRGWPRSASAVGYAACHYLRRARATRTAPGGRWPGRATPWPSSRRSRRHRRQRDSAAHHLRPVRHFPTLRAVPRAEALSFLPRVVGRVEVVDRPRPLPVELEHRLPLDVPEVLRARGRPPVGPRRHLLHY